MSQTITPAALALLVGSGKTFAYASLPVQAMLPASHELKTQDFNGSCRYHGGEADYGYKIVMASNELAAGYAGGADRLPLADDLILLENLPSCSRIMDIVVSCSVAGTTHRYDDIAGAEAEFELEKAKPNATPPVAAVTGPRSICEDTVPAANNTRAWPKMEIWIGNAAGPKTDFADPASFGAIMAVDNTGAVQPELHLLRDTGRSGDQWLIWAKMTADVPADAYAAVMIHTLKGR